ncbi:hypothetical protein A3A60_00075 [Candidatus Curtissbacteria bacterium RIFCSPLOWO2_01_FULL_42_26]|uniref:ASCH domain-containing protein n=1 Tax=Candidatus Curtissbacteria bacterium RIFCSPLOWO2_01_FULL_42_26 TaxID=1797729 RepID=A0A1F5HZY8_9BACT|nr:MAG: hypothetical protein A3A60_00075 [Candidatus Curtissbacteria bacterium RIFCSPLOWO2_01_FULL_42_26]
MVRHLAIFDRESARDIFSGRKKIEGRFSQIKIAPYGKVSAGDAVLIKISGEEVVGQFLVDRVIYFDHPKNVEVEEIKKKYGRSLALPATFWLEREKIKFITLMFIKSATKFIIPPQIAKKDLRAWVVLG